MATEIRKMTNTQREELRKAIDSIKTGDYKGTAIKLELEAQLGRGYTDDDDFCGDCEGDGYYYCNYCDEGAVICEECNGGGCEDCHGDGSYDCDMCGGRGEDGRVTCETCDGNGRYNPDDGGWSNARCRDFMLDNVPKSAKDALIYSKFYNDGSVDSEFTLTLPIDKAHMTVYFIEAFNELAKAVGGGMDTERAGMHIAILNSENGNYPGGNNLENPQLENFKNAVTPLLPALYFLASSDHNARGLGYRNACIGVGKEVAINYLHNCFEYRIFETCYKRPLAMIDNIVVIANTLKFYKRQPTNTSIKLGELGIKDGSGLERFYYTLKHVDALEHGLKILKPSYKSVEQLNKERNVKINRDELRKKENKRRQEWAKEFDEVKERRRFERLRLYHQGLAEAYTKLGYGESIDIQEYARTYRNNAVKSRGAELKGSCRDYIKEKQERFQTENVACTIMV